MRKTREILRLKWLLGRSHREIASVLSVGLGTTTQVVSRAKRAMITNWAELEAIGDAELEVRMYPPAVKNG
ncbi:MAG TPA: IS21 family transposase, partial [Kofleriaceae bacterium]